MLAGALTLRSVVHPGRNGREAMAEVWDEGRLDSTEAYPQTVSITESKF